MTLDIPAAGDGPTVHVLAGVLADAEGRVLLAERPVGKAFAGRWEFPGGKLEPGEEPRQALVRELREELGIDVEDAAPLLAVTHRYPGARASVLIDCWRVTRWRGAPRSLDGQRLRWCATTELPQVDILEADRPIVTALRLPRVFVAGDDPAGVLHDPASVPSGGIAVYSTYARVAPAGDRATLVGCLVTDAYSSRAAAERGADFLLVSSPVDAATGAALVALGLPWYVDDRHGSAVPAGATGTWRRGPRG